MYVLVIFSVISVHQQQVNRNETNIGKGIGYDDATRGQFPRTLSAVLEFHDILSLSIKVMEIA